MNAFEIVVTSTASAVCQLFCLEHAQEHTHAGLDFLCRLLEAFRDPHCNQPRMAFCSGRATHDSAVDTPNGKFDQVVANVVHDLRDWAPP